MSDNNRGAKNKIILVLILVIDIIAICLGEIITNRIFKFWSIIFVLSMSIILISYYVISIICQRIKLNNKPINYFCGSIVAALCTLFIYLVDPTFLYMYKDIPSMMYSKYASIVGNITNVKISNDRHPEEVFYVNGMSFSIQYKDFKIFFVEEKSEYVDYVNLSRGEKVFYTVDQKYRITYLPYSKFVLSISKIND